MLSCGGVTILVYDSTGTTLLYSNASAATLTDGHVTFRLSYALTAGTTYVIKAQVNDLAGNTGTGAGLDQLGDVRVSHALDLDQSDGSAWGARHIERRGRTSRRPWRCSRRAACSGERSRTAICGVGCTATSGGS